MADENDNFEEQVLDGFAHLKETLMKVDESAVHEEFDSLTDAEKLFIFAKKLIIPKEDFDAETKVRDLLQKNHELKAKIEEQDAKFGKVVREKEAEIAGLNDDISSLSELVKETTQQRDEFSDLCSQLKSVNELDAEDAYAFEVKYNSVRTQRDELLTLCDQKKKDIATLTHQLNDSRTKCDSYRTAHDELFYAKKDLVEDIQDLCDQKAQADEELLSLRTAKAQADEELLSLRTENKEQKEEIAKLKAQLAKLDSSKTQRLLALKQSIKDLVADSQ
jgi:chromosome segregation ATPase